MIHTPLKRVSMVASIMTTTATMAEALSTMTPRPHQPAGQGAGHDVPTSRQVVRTQQGHRRSGRPGHDVAAPFPLTNDHGREIRDHHRVEAEIREVAEISAAIGADRRAYGPGDPHQEAAA